MRPFLTFVISATQGCAGHSLHQGGGGQDVGDPEAHRSLHHPQPLRQRAVRPDSPRHGGEGTQQDPKVQGTARRVHKPRAHRPERVFQGKLS